MAIDRLADAVDHALEQWLRTGSDVRLRLDVLRAAIASALAEQAVDPACEFVAERSVEWVVQQASYRIANRMRLDDEVLAIICELARRAEQKNRVQKC